MPKSRRFRWPPKDASDLQCQSPEIWLNELDLSEVSQGVYDVLLVMIGHIRFLENENREHHLRICRLEDELEDVRKKPYGAPLNAPFQPTYHEVKEPTNE